MTPRAAALVLTALALLAGGCATLSGINPPRVNVSNVTPQDMTLFEQRFLVQLRVQNPNDMDLELKAMTFDLDLNGKSFATGLSNKAVTIPRFGSNVVDVEVISGLTSFLRQLKSFTGGTAPRFAYRLRGKLYLEKPVSTTLPFDEAGELELPGLNDPVK